MKKQKSQQDINKDIQYHLHPRRSSKSPNRTTSKSSRNGSSSSSQSPKKLSRSSDSKYNKKSENSREDNLPESYRLRPSDSRDTK